MKLTAGIVLIRNSRLPECDAARVKRLENIPYA